MNTSKFSSLIGLSHTKFKRCTGLSKHVFDLMSILVKDYAKKHKRKVGRPSKLIVEDQILMLLEYYREYRTFFHLGLSYGLDESNAHRTIIKIENILIKSGYFRLEGKKVLASNQKIKQILIDVTETPAQRPKKKFEIN